VDLSKVKEVEKAVNNVVKKSNKIHLLVNNAGTSLGKPALDTGEKEYITLNQIGQLLCRVVPA
jgi:short-subunit dehydrogenase